MKEAIKILGTDFFINLLVCLIGYYLGWASCQPEPPYPSDEQSLKSFSGRSSFDWSSLEKVDFSDLEKEVK